MHTQDDASSHAYDATIYGFVLDQLPLTTQNCCHHMDSSRADSPVDAVFSSCDGKSYQARCPQCSHYLLLKKKNKKTSSSDAANAVKQMDFL